MFEGSFKGDSRIFKESFKGVSRQIEGDFKGDFIWFQGYLKELKREFQERYVKDVSTKIEVCFKCVGRVFRRS